MNGGQEITSLVDCHSMLPTRSAPATPQRLRKHQEMLSLRLPANRAGCADENEVVRVTRPPVAPSLKPEVSSQARQKVGENNTSTVKISSLPSSMAKALSHFTGSVMPAKLEATSPRPGPTLLMQAATAEKAVT